MDFQDAPSSLNTSNNNVQCVGYKRETLEGNSEILGLNLLGIGGRLKGISNNLGLNQLVLNQLVQVQYCCQVSNQLDQVWVHLCLKEQNVS